MHTPGLAWFSSEVLRFHGLEKKIRLGKRVRKNGCLCLEMRPEGLTCSGVENGTLRMEEFVPRTKAIGGVNMGEALPTCSMYFEIYLWSSHHDKVRCCKLNGAH